MGEADHLRAQARKWRELARLTTDDRAIRTLLEMADEYDARADLMHPTQMIEILLAVSGPSTFERQVGNSVVCSGH